MNRGTAFEPAPLQAWCKSAVAHHRPAVSAASATPSAVASGSAMTLGTVFVLIWPTRVAVVGTPTAATPDQLAWEPIVGVALIAKSREHSYAWSRF